MQAAVGINIDGRWRWVRAGLWVPELVGNEWALYVCESLASSHVLPLVNGDVETQEDGVHVDIGGHGCPAMTILRDPESWQTGFRVRTQIGAPESGGEGVGHGWWYSEP